eukprot:TRINITY_DN8118_c0_g1_i1.p1 TRINITY_DN8118_c0_g1~~TRINITY_DN8118_c0_g1_i1.p1  ORF type:complete len:150 (+),score=28.80 TRINITY_DN8118_c0_g1_i1:121-570(+)
MNWFSPPKKRTYSIFDKRDFDADKIAKNLYLGSEDAALALDQLNKRNIKAIVTVAKDIEPAHLSAGIKYLVIRVDDVPQTNLMCAFDVAYEFINRERKKGPVLVHCAAGISRSTTIVMSYLMRKKKTHLPEGIRTCEKTTFVCLPELKF